MTGRTTRRRQRLILSAAICNAARECAIPLSPFGSLKRLLK